MRGGDKSPRYFVFRARLRGAVSLAALLVTTGVTAAFAEPSYDVKTVVGFFRPRIAYCVLDCPGPQAFNLGVQFEFGSSKLSGRARENLQIFARALDDPVLRDQRFEIEGFADASGVEAGNVTLSRQRAAEVANYLVGQGVDSARLRERGFGSARPLSSDPLDAANRRAEARLLGRVR